MQAFGSFFTVFNMPVNASGLVIGASGAATMSFPYPSGDRGVATDFRFYFRLT